MWCPATFSQLEVVPTVFPLMFPPPDEENLMNSALFPLFPLFPPPDERGRRRATKFGRSLQDGSLWRRRCTFKTSGNTGNTLEKGRFQVGTRAGTRWEQREQTHGGNSLSHASATSHITSQLDHTSGINMTVASQQPTVLVHSIIHIAFGIQRRGLCFLGAGQLTTIEDFFLDLIPRTNEQYRDLIAGVANFHESAAGSANAKASQSKPAPRKRDWNYPAISSSAIQETASKPLTTRHGDRTRRSIR
jgi:hypothetical protein